MLGVIAALLAIIAMELAPSGLWLALRDAKDDIKAVAIGRNEELPAPVKEQPALSGPRPIGMYEQEALDAIADRIAARSASAAASR